MTPKRRDDLRRNSRRFKKRNRAKVLAAGREYYQKNKERILKKGRDNQKETYAKRRKKSLEYNKSAARKYSSLKSLLKRRYGITPEQLSILYANQNGKCYLCGVRKDMLGKGQNRLHVDHDHETNMVRGLLCNTCNTIVMPVFDKWPHLIGKAFEYKANPPAAKLF